VGWPDAEWGCLSGVGVEFHAWCFWYIGTDLLHVAPGLAAYPNRECPHMSLTSFEAISPEEFMYNNAPVAYTPRLHGFKVLTARSLYHDHLEDLCTLTIIQYFNYYNLIGQSF
jgi:hypothetical protein